MSHALPIKRKGAAWQVYKFGGTSLGNPGSLPQALNLIEEALGSGTRLTVIVSALGHTTDHLLAAARAARSGNRAGARSELSAAKTIAQRVSASVLSGRARQGFLSELDRILSDTNVLLSKVARSRECPKEILDEIVAAGEPIAASLLAAAANRRGIAARAVDAREFLLADEGAGGTVVDWNGTRRSFSKMRKTWGATLPIVTGFIARARNGRTTTLGRNGSDYTASLLAALLKAEQVTIWTDVLGVMTADPAFVAEAIPVDRLSYDEALELAYFGTRMFHPRTIIPLRDCGATLRIRSTANSKAAGTLVDAKGQPDTDRPTCVTSLENLTLLGVVSRKAGIGRPIAGRVVSALDAAGLRVWLATESTLGETFSVVLPLADEARAKTLIQEILADSLDSREATLAPPITPVTMVTLVAETMGRRPNVAGQFLSAIGRAGIPIRAVAQGASQRSISCIVDAADTVVAVRTVHAAFNLAHAEMSIFLLGKGIVGKSLLVLLHDQERELRIHHDVQVRLVGLAGRTSAVFAPEGIAPSRAVGQLMRSSSGSSAANLPNLLSSLARLPNPVLVDCTAADGMESTYMEAFARGINVVSANKKPLALPSQSRDALFAAARKQFRAFHYETTVGAGLPVIETLKNLVRTGDKVLCIEGALSGTLGYLCERLAAGEPLSEAVKRARDLGFTEPNPRDDLSGLDVARKALILARELGLKLDLGDVALTPLVSWKYLQAEGVEAFMAGIGAADAAIASRVNKAHAKGHLLRYLARIEPGASGPMVTVGPIEVEASHPAAVLHGAEALVAFKTERYRDYPLIVRGAGAGGDVTAAGVLADILRLAQNIRGRA